MTRELTPVEAKASNAFAGYIVRKDLVHQVKGNAVVPSYVLEFLLAQYCATTNEEEIRSGVESVRKILAAHYVNRGESELIKSRIREQGGYRIIDKVSVSLDEANDRYVASFENLGVANALVSDQTVRDNDRLLTGGVWCMADMSYFPALEGAKTAPWNVSRLQAIQLPRFSFEEYADARGHFTTQEWIDLLVASVGLDPSKLSERAKMLQVLRLVPYVERNYNLVELGPKGTGKSHIYSEFSPHGILVSGGEVTLAKLFVNNATHRIGLVGFWDVVAFDEFAGRKRVEQNLVDTMKNYLANKSFSRGDSPTTAQASMVFVGNTMRTVPAMLATSDLFEALPDAYHDTAYMDRIHYYLPGWEVDVIRPELFTSGYGFIVDYLAEAFRHLRTLDFSGDLSGHFELDSHMSTRDRDAVRKTFSGLVKLIHPDRDGTPAELESLLRLAMEGRKRVKDQIIRLDETMRESGSHFLYTVSASGGERSIRTQEEIDYPEYFTADDDRPAGEPPTTGGTHPQPPVGGAAQETAPSPADRLDTLRSRAIPKREEVEARIGVSLPKMLLPYLVDAREITIIDPYLRKRHQIANIHDILIHLVQAVGLAAPPRVHLTTGRAEPDRATEQTQLLNDLSQTWGHFGVEIDYEFVADIHDRVIKTDTGWVIDLGRGLDVYERFQALSRFDPRFDLMELRRTKGFTFNAQRAE